MAGAAARSAASGVPLRDVLIATPHFVEKLSEAGIGQAQVDEALDPAGYLGASQGFIAAALDAHARG